nr:hypothetical protein [Petrachloros mirabilis]
MLTYPTTKPNTQPDFVEGHGVQYTLVKPSAYDYEYSGLQINSLIPQHL